MKRLKPRPQTTEVKTETKTTPPQTAPAVKTEATTMPTPSTRTSYDDDLDVAEAPPREDNDHGSLFFLKFYHPNQNTSFESQQAARAITGEPAEIGRPFVSTKIPAIDPETGEVKTETVDGEQKPVYVPKVTDCADSAFVILAQKQFWAAKAKDAPYDMTWASNDQQKFNAKAAGLKVQENFLAQVLVLTADGPVLALTEVRGAKIGFITKTVKAAKESRSKEWAKANGALANHPVRFRMPGTFDLSTKSGGFGPYAIVSANPAPATAEQIAAINAWCDDEGADSDREAVKALFDKKATEIDELAAKSKPLS